MIKMTLAIIATVLVLLLMGCSSHQITSSPPNATIYLYQAAGRHPVYGPWSVDNKPTPEQMRKAMESSHPIVTPHTFGGGPFDHWYQVRKEGYLNSDIVLLKESDGTLSHNFILEKRSDSSTAEK